MIAKTKIGPFRATWVLRHRWERGAKDGVLSNNYEGYKLRTTLRLGIWANRSKVVGATKRGKDGKMVVSETFSTNNTVNTYMIGLDLIVCRVWVDFSFRPTLGRK
jgi:hypothetical protein